MKSEYFIKKLDKSKIEKQIFWDGIYSANIDCCPWGNDNNLPKADAKIVYDNQSFYVFLRAFEKDIKATYKKVNDFVHKDSCLEFFFNPDPESDLRYINFEFNPLGTIYFSIGSDRYSRKLLGDNERKRLRIQSYFTQEIFWVVKFEIPFSFIEKYYSSLNFYEGKVMKGNFYKCGDETEKPHYGCWSPIISDFPDFHKPEYFGNLILK